MLGSKSSSRIGVSRGRCRCGMNARRPWLLQASRRFLRAPQSRRRRMTRFSSKRPLIPSPRRRMCALMADAKHPRPLRQADALPLPECVALVLQGGGALGSYQAGVIEGLASSGIEIDWVAGISIGAVNAAIFAGNPPHKRVEMLTAFWDMVTSSLPSFPIYPDDHLREWLHEWSAGYV